MRDLGLPRAGTAGPHPLCPSRRPFQARASHRGACICVTLGCNESVQQHCLRCILRNALRICTLTGEVGLCKCMTWVSREPEQSHWLHQVFCNALAVSIDPAEVGLRLCETLDYREPPKPRSLRRVLCSALAMCGRPTGACLCLCGPWLAASRYSRNASTAFARRSPFSVHRAEDVLSTCKALVCRQPDSRDASASSFERNS